MKVTFAVRPKYLSLWQENKRYYILMGGRGGGRSTAVSQYLNSRLFGKEYMRAAIMRAVHSNIRHTSWKELTDRLDEQGVREAVKIKENDMNLHYGRNSIQAHGFRASSGSNSAKLKSLAGYNVVWIEEAEEIGEEEFKKLDDTLRTLKGDIKIILSLNSPAKSHWIVRRWFDLEPSGIDGFYTPTLKPEHEDTCFISSNYLDNLINLDPNTVRRYENYADTDPDHYYQAIMGLVPDVVKGKIYSDWRLIDEVPHEAKLMRFGLDFGWFPDPAHLLAIYYYDGGYILDEVAHGLEIANKTLAEMILSQRERALTVADGAEPKSIKEIRGYGVNITRAEQGPGSVDYGIKVVSNLRISVTRRSKNLWHAYENYAWAVDKDGNPKGEPVHTWSHPMDAARYGLTSIDSTVPPDQAEREAIRHTLSVRENMSRATARHGL